MEFRWAVLIALWTLLAGPAFDASSPSANQGRKPSPSAASAKVRVERTKRVSARHTKVHTPTSNLGRTDH
jgi:hypothetical protein